MLWFPSNEGSCRHRLIHWKHLRHVFCSPGRNFKLLWSKLAVVYCHRIVMELKETLKSKNEEGDAYISEIEVMFFPLYLAACTLLVMIIYTLLAIYLLILDWHFPYVIWLQQTIGQAYEEMQTQNQRLLQQITERDDYTTHVHISPQSSCSTMSMLTNFLYVLGKSLFISLPDWWTILVPEFMCNYTPLWQSQSETVQPRVELHTSFFVVGATRDIGKT